MVTGPVTKNMRDALERNDRDQTFDLITANEVLTINKSDLAGKKRIETSMMPEGILDTLSEQQVTDFLASCAVIS